MSQLKVNALVSYSGNTVTLGTSGDTINVASNVTFNTASGTLTLPSTIKVDTIQNTNSSTLITQTNSTTITVGVSGQTVALPSQSISYAAISNAVDFRNIVINGDMQIAQRATSKANIGFEYGTVDRWQTVQGGLGAFTQSQSTDVPSGYGFATSLKMDCTTADATPASGDELYVRQLFEGQNLQYLKKGTANAVSLTASFWVKSTKTGTFIVELVDDDNSRSVSKSYTVNTTDTWEYKTVTFPADTTGAFTNDNGQSLNLNFWIGTGSGQSSGTLQTSWGSIVTANRAVGQVNCADSTSNDWLITGVQLEAGEQASGFEFIPIDVSLGRCQRYFSKSATNTGLTGCGVMTCVTFNQTELFGYCPWPVTMRATPTVTIFDNAGNSGAVHQIGSPDISGCTPGTISSVALSQITKTNGFTSSRLYAFTYKADAEL